MESLFLNYLSINNLSIIETPGGNVLKGLLSSDSSFNGFGEAYFSEIESGAIKGWKYHKQMTLNLIVPKGKVKFVFCVREQDNDKFEEIVIGEKKYQRITVKPGIWFGFQGVDSEKSLILNIADIPHMPQEVDRLNLNEIKYNW
jgi:dTDP-4-dehydrorhamnose 3,5-epimerase